VPVETGTQDVAPPVSSDEEESIESYMERLMKRVRGDSPAAAGRMLPVEPPTAPPALAPQPVAPAPPQEPAEEPAGEYSPRRTAPELATNMSAMRELANTAARSAIDRHVRQHTGRQALGKLFGALLTVAFSGVVGYWSLRAQSLGAGVAALLGGGLGFYWTWAAVRRLAVLRRLNQLPGVGSQPSQDSPPKAASK
jgi:hypothetical protein